MSEFTDLLTISQMRPGPIAINAATFVGIRVAGLGGAAVATVGCVLAPCVIVLLIAKLYFRYRKLDLLGRALSLLRPAVVAMIASAGVSIVLSALFSAGAGNILARADVSMIVAFGACFALLRLTKLNPVLVMLLAGVIELAAGYIEKLI